MKNVNKKIASTPKKQSKLQLLITGTVSFFKNYWKVIAGIVLLVGGIREFIGLRRDLETPHEKLERDNPKGNITSSKISEFTLLKTLPNFSYDSVNYKYPKVKGIYIKDLSKRTFLPIQIGGKIIVVPTINLYYGIDIINPVFKACTNSSLELVAKNDRLYISAKFIDFKTENEIGKMEFNRWKIYKDTFLDYTYSDDRFEIIDKQGNIVFSILYFKRKSEYSAFVSIAGYFITPTSVLILNNKELFSLDNKYVKDHNNECIQKSDSNWKLNSQIEMDKIQSTFNYNQ